MLRGLFSFDHVPHAAVGSSAGLDEATAQAFMTNYNGYGFAVDSSPIPLAITNWASGTVQDAEGVWMASSAGGAGGGGTLLGAKGWAIPIGTVMDWTTTASYIGFRMKMGTVLSPTAYGGSLYTPNPATLAIPYVWIGSPTGTVYGGILSLIDTVKFPNANWVTGVSVYVEIKIDRTNKLITVWVDNVMLTQFVFDPTQITAASQLVFGSSGNWATSQSSVGMTVMFKDMYFVDNTQDARVPNGRLGLLTGKQFAMASAAGTGWTSSDSQALLTDLTTPITQSAGSLAAPLVTSPANVASPELDLTFSNTLPAATPLIAVGFAGSGQRQAASLTSMSFLLKDTATPTPNQEQLANASPPAPLTTGRLYGGGTTVAPDGTALDSTKAASLILKITTGAQPLAV